jgi:hypothetical protein
LCTCLQLREEAVSVMLIYFPSLLHVIILSIDRLTYGLIFDQEFLKTIKAEILNGFQIEFGQHIRIMCGLFILT